jgi:hypothetical protein
MVVFIPVASSATWPVIALLQMLPVLPGLPVLPALPLVVAMVVSVVAVVEVMVLQPTGLLHVTNAADPTTMHGTARHKL